MRRTRFIDPAGSIRIGDWTDGRIKAAGRTFIPENIRILPPVTPNKIIGAYRNYVSLWDEEPIPNQPKVWFKGASNSLAGYGDTICLPPGEVIFEAELGIVIGEQCRNIPAEQATEVIGGYTCVNDITRADPPVDGMFASKCWDNSASMGPVVASPDLVPENPRIQLWQNGELKQDSKGEEYVFPAAEIIESVTSQLTLERDDVIMMGTPPGYDTLGTGDEVTIEVEGIGKLMNTFIK